MTIKNRFLTLLQEKGAKENRRISYAEVKKSTGIAESTLSQWAQNNVTKYDTATIEALCRYLGCQPGDLIVMEDSPTIGK